MGEDSSFGRYLSQKNEEQGGGQGDCRSVGSEGSAGLVLAGHHKFSTGGFLFMQPTLRLKRIKSSARFEG